MTRLIHVLCSKRVWEMLSLRIRPRPSWYPVLNRISSFGPFFIASNSFTQGSRVRKMLNLATVLSIEASVIGVMNWTYCIAKLVIARPLKLWFFDREYFIVTWKYAKQPRLRLHIFMQKKLPWGIIRSREGSFLTCSTYGLKSFNPRFPPSCERSLRAITRGGKLKCTRM